MTESFYKKLLDNVSDLIWAVDMEGRFMYINDNIKEWGYDKDELIGKPFVNILNTRRIGKRESEISMLGMSQTFEMEIIDKRGKTHKVVVKSSPLQGDKGDIIGVMGIIRDVTEMQLLEQKLKNEERMASLGLLATGIAHEIRNPLSSVKMNLAILKQRLKPEGVDIEHFEIAQEEVANLEYIVTELLDYAKPIKLDLVRLDLAKAIENALATIKGDYQQKKISIRTSFDSEAPMALIDEVKMHQVLLNVLLNAVQASDSGSRIEVITQFINTPPEKLRIIVNDSGHGIHADDMKYIFDPFFSKKKNGAGLGLSIARNIINNHGGDIRIDPLPEKGVSVCLELPAN
ncbi:MAG TPA: PAS domain S-box protein [Nitrospirae bacterium]|nr:PAS domain S-box protein [Nitrospirota bacterium]